MTAPGDALRSADEDGLPRILVVDDNVEMLSSLRDIVELRGWRTDGAGSGEEAVRKFEDADYDAVLMDVRMPGMNGVDALRAMKRRRPRVPVILMTAYSARDLMEAAGDEGVAEVLSKPVAIEALYTILDEIRGT